MALAHSAQAHAHQAVDAATPRNDTNRPLEKAARLGYGAKGVVYLVLGVLATMAAFGKGGQVGGSQDALHAIYGQPFGKILLGVVALGLVCYVIWRAAQAIKNPNNEKTIKRVGYAISGLLYAALAVRAATLVFQGGGSQGGGNSAQTWTAKIMEQGWGVWVVGIAGAIIMGYAVKQFINAYKTEFMRKLKTEEMSEKVEKGVRFSGRLGLSARGVVFLLIGGFLIWAALTFDPSKAQGLEGALLTLQSQAYGPWLLGVVAIGLACYGVYQFAQARFRSFRDLRSV